MPPLRVIVRSGGVEQEFFHDEGPLEFGRSTQSDYPRCVIADPTVSRDHLRVTLQPNGWLFAENLSRSLEILRDGGPPIPINESHLVGLPVVLSIGNTDVGIGLATGAPPVFREAVPAAAVAPEPASPVPGGFPLEAPDEAATRVGAVFAPEPEAPPPPPPPPAPVPAAPEPEVVPEPPRRAPAPPPFAATPRPAPPPPPPPEPVAPVAQPAASPPPEPVTAAPEPPIAAPPPPPPPAPEPVVASRPAPRALTVPGLAAGLESIAPPAAFDQGAAVGELSDLGEPVEVATWFERLLLRQYSASTAEELTEATVRALIDLAGFDSAVALLEGSPGVGWNAAASAPEGAAELQPASEVIEPALRLRRTIFQPVSSAAGAQAASPILGATGVTGALVAAKEPGVGGGGPGVTALEAAVLQVLAAALSAGLAQEPAPVAPPAEPGARRFPVSVLERIREDGGVLQATEREITVMSSAIRNFPRLAARLGPANTLRLIEEVRALLTRHTHGNEGTILGEQGERFLAAWNVPLEAEEPAASACEAARAIQSAMPALAEAWEPMAGEPVSICLAIHTGVALAGPAGEAPLDSYTVVGATVTIAERLQGAAEALGTPILITRATRDRLIGEDATRRLGSLRFREATEPVHVLELNFAPEPQWSERRDRYEWALARYEAGDWLESAKALGQLVVADGEIDIPAAELLSRATACLRDNPVDFEATLL